MSMGRLIYLLAIGVLVALAFAVLKFAISGAITKRHVWEVARATTFLVCMALVSLSGHGNIGPWGAWVGFSGVTATLLITLIVSRAARRAD